MLTFGFTLLIILQFLQHQALTSILSFKRDQTLSRNITSPSVSDNCNPGSAEIYVTINAKSKENVIRKSRIYKQTSQTCHFSAE